MLIRYESRRPRRGPPYEGGMIPMKRKTARCTALSLLLALAFSDTVSCSRGYDYLLEVDVTVVGDSGSDYITQSASAYCS